MKTIRLALAALIGLGASSALAAPENRCGWVMNPTPGNWYLLDRDGDWTLSEQGSENEALGMENIGDISAGDYVASNGNYGYACGCMKVEADHAAKRITAVYSFSQKKISQCSKDKSLPKPE
ncbi:DUF4087 domain-containing protein [Gellertiella hungarica]|uniref:DUF4087 domain-containing protein n=1 Tax=Gellertiella hungarica TaxID=1572859 RepID=A0A7W6J2L7_9HYPH|nr:DUF4087 domain-containing protein [Gellertiella hungarica]MBB4063619.1 hypothetical protein [Gellertiella hungarica]